MRERVALFEGLMELLVLGASVRALAQSARRAGLRPWAIDLFADSDLAAVATTEKLDLSDYPDGLFERARRAPPGPWMYSGGLENHPTLVDRIARDRTLWGNTGAVLRQVRDPFVIQDVLNRSGLPSPELARSWSDLPADGSWLIKPVRSGGGRAVRRHQHGHRSPEPSGGEPCYAQRSISGRSCAALALAFRKGARLLGLSEQRIGASGLEFAYAGSVAPVSMPPRLRTTIARIVEVLAVELELLGLFGVDLVIAGDTPWPVEVNPRYTAAVEVFELVHRVPLLDWHRRACSGESVPSGDLPEPSRCLGKAILFAEDHGAFPETCRWRPGDRSGFRAPALADVPWPGTPFAPQDPVITVFASGTNVAQVHRRLDRVLGRARTALGRPIDKPSMAS